MTVAGEGGRRAVVVGATAAAEGVASHLAAQGWSVASIDPTGEVGLGPATSVDGAAPQTVVLAHLRRAAWPTARLVDLAPDAWDAAGEGTIRDVLVALQAIHAAVADGARIVVVLPTVSTIGVPGLVPMCTAVEAVRVMAKVAARRWGGRGITVNIVLVPLASFLGEHTPEGVEVPSLGVASLPGRDPLEDAASLVQVLSAPEAAALTGATLGADAGTVMVP
jgi:NAD(P)-dependent dehydrogenase (short-subunit alcohol dehydrogenase family)